MAKTAVIHDDVHEMILNKKKELKEKHGFDIQITDIINNIIRRNIEEFDLEMQDTLKIDVKLEK